MAIRKMVQLNLLRNAVSAYFAAIELHNKPNFDYRYESVTLLLINAWELLLKAYIRKYIKHKSIYENGDHTITLGKAIKYVNDSINAKIPKKFIATKENLLLLEDYRNMFAHYYNDRLDPFIFMLLSRAVINFSNFIKEYFFTDVASAEGLFILPIGFKLPFRPEDFLSQKNAIGQMSLESREFISKIVKTISDLKDNNIEESIVLGYSVFLESSKKLTNSDLLVAITSIEKADATIVQTKKVQIVNDPSAVKVQLSDSELLERFPLTYSDICKQCKESIDGFVQNSNFNEIMKSIKQQPSFVYHRRLDPKNQKSSVKSFYAKEVIDEIQQRYSDPLK